MAGEFHFGDQLRNIKWIGMVPADLTYTIGASKERDDWYFAQGKPGNVGFDGSASARRRHTKSSPRNCTSTRIRRASTMTFSSASRAAKTPISQ